MYRVIKKLDNSWVPFCADNREAFIGHALSIIYENLTEEDFILMMTKKMKFSFLEIACCKCKKQFSIKTVDDVPHSDLICDECGAFVIKYAELPDSK